MAIPRSSYVASAAVAVLAAVVFWPTEARPLATPDEATFEKVVSELDEALERHWQDADVTPTADAEERVVLRRLSLALTGALPSLEEIRNVETLPAKARVAAHLEHLLGDRRFADYLAERFARAFVGDDEGPFLVFRRRRFVYWLSDSITEGRPYDEVVRAMIAGTGLWTDRPETNFITGHQRDPVQLAARTTRAFLGMRLDCAQCHDHPFAHWKQSDFQGLAAHYAGIEQGVSGIADAEDEFRPGGRMMMMADDVPVAEPRVPFAESAWPAQGTRRERLAAWVTSPDNEAFGKAIANRMWTMMLGTSLTKSGVDDIEGVERAPELLAILGRDFTEHGHDLRRLIRVIARSRAFRRAPQREREGGAEHYAAFPITKLRPEQIALSLVQISQLHSVGADAHIFWRLMKATSVRDFIARYGDSGDEELREQQGTLMQQLVLMNGKIVRERLEANLLNAAGRIALLAPDDAQRVRVAYLVCYTREPTPPELEHFVAQLAATRGDDRQRAMEDMLWTLINATEFSWNH